MRVLPLPLYTCSIHTHVALFLAHLRVHALCVCIIRVGWSAGARTDALWGFRIYIYVRAPHALQSINLRRVSLYIFVLYARAAALYAGGRARTPRGYSLSKMVHE